MASRVIFRRFRSYLLSSCRLGSMDQHGIFGRCHDLVFLWSEYTMEGGVDQSSVPVGSLMVYSCP
jgi:hypothetical protein